MRSLGVQLIIELKDCQSDTLDDVEFIRATMLYAAETAGATIVADKFHHFSPFGVSGVVVIAESHLTIHTWPEHNYAAIDLFTCGETLKPMIAVEYLIGMFESRNPSVMEIKRGILT